jgi:hypothetical protein
VMFPAYLLPMPEAVSSASSETSQVRISSSGRSIPTVAVSLIDTPQDAQLGRAS